MLTNTEVTQHDGGIGYGYWEPRNEVIMSRKEEVTRRAVGDRDDSMIR